MIPTRFCPVCGAVNDEADAHCFACGLELADDAQSGSAGQGTLLHARYRVGSTIGSGGYSAVYRGWDTQEGGRAVAIKQITLHGLDTEATIEATNTYNREIEALSTLNHPQVPRLYDHFSDQDHWYLILEYIEGQTLERYLEARAAQNRPFQIEEVLNIGLQLCAVLAYLHSRHPAVIFRDLKPDNIMRTSSGKLYLIDFGIARHYTPGQSRDTQSLGSPGYAAPEQYGRAQTTPRTDLYGLGALLHQLLSGHDPSETPRALPPLRLNGQPGCAELEALVSRLLASDPQDRPASAHDVARELERIRHKRVNVLDSQRIWQPPAPQNYPGTLPPQVQQQFQILQQQAAVAKRKRLTRRRVLIGLGAGVTAGVLGGSVYAWTAGGQASQVAQSPALYTYTEHTDTVNGLVWSPDSSRIASVSADGSMRVWNASHGVTGYTSSNIAAINTVAWSADGTYIAFSRNDGSIWLWDDAHAQEVGAIFQGNSRINALAWSPDMVGHQGFTIGYLASGGDDGIVRILDVADQDAREVTILAEYADSLAYSPDGWYLATGGASSEASVKLWDMKMYRRVYAVYRGHSAAVTGLAWLPNGVYLASASVDETVQVWSAVSGATLFTCKGHESAVNAVAPSPDGNYLASASDDKTVQIWSAYDGKHLMTYTGHKGAVTTVSWSPNGKYIASGSADKTVQVWRPPSFSS
ncbi:MAG TPA: serine/threonine-protein kinase [Ktedonobacteraceae bacterium]|nr:serine/threonine-protein kinase [Ktedonobacteraceae bacterium]